MKTGQGRVDWRHAKSGRALTASWACRCQSARRMHTFVVFRRRFREAKLHGKLFDSVLAHIEQQGLLIREGTLVDAAARQAA